MKQFLKFSPGNAKLYNRGIAVFSLPAGLTCPGACECLARFDRKLRKVIDGPNQKHRCYAASYEAVYPSVQNAVDHNFALLKEARTVENLTTLIHESLPGFYFDKVRIHGDGDFFNSNYFVAWTQVAAANPNRLFYAYTKSVHYWLDHINLVPKNLVLNASMGGKFDDDAIAAGLRRSTVVYHPNEAKKLRIKIDHDDSLAMDPKVKHFALLIHGTQPKGSAASEAIKRLKKENIQFSYGKGKA